MGYSKTINIKGENAKRVAAVVAQYSDIVTSTMGPGGNTVVIQSAQGVLATKDGITVARHLAPRDTFERAIAQLLVDASNRTVKEVGDGTTTTICLIDALYGIWTAMHESSVTDLNQFVKGMDAAVEDVLRYLGGNAKGLVDQDGKIKGDVLNHVALVACNGDAPMAAMISNLIADIGPKGRVLMRKNLGNYCYTEKLGGYTFPSQILGRQHLEAAALIELDNPLFVIVLDSLEQDKDIVPIVNTWLESSELRTEHGQIRPLVIITSGLVGSARSYVAANAKNSPIYVVQLGLGGQEGLDVAGDIKDMTGVATVFHVNTGGRTISNSWGQEFEGEEGLTDSEPWKEFGRAEKCILSATQCSVIPTKRYEEMGGSELKVRGLEIRIAASKDEVEIEHLKRRVASLSAGVGIIYVGANSEAEAARVAGSIDDAQRACFAALQSGVMPGCGRGFVNAALHLGSGNYNILKDDPFQKGYGTILVALTHPAYKVFSNFMGISMDHAQDYVIALNGIDKWLEDFWGGWNIYGEPVKDMYASGIIDPLMVAQSALRNAVSVAKQLICAKYVLVEDVLPAVVGIANPDDALDEHVDKNTVRQLYQKLDNFLKKKEDAYGHE